MEGIDTLLHFEFGMTQNNCDVTATISHTGTTLEGDLSEVGALFRRHFAPDEPPGEKTVAVKFMDFFFISLPFQYSTVQYCVLPSQSFQIPGR